MKIQCPACGREGNLEIKGNSKLVVHYEGMSDEKIVLVRHPIGKKEWENGKRDKADSSLFSQK